MRVTLNMAASLDGRVSAPDGGPLRLSSPEDHQRVHRLRATHDAILVGVGTVLADDPRLTARTDPAPRRQPLRVVLDTGRRTPADARVLDDAAPTLLVTGSAGPDKHGHADVVVLGEGRPGPDVVVGHLAERGIGTLLVEGGPTVARSLLDAGLVDRFELYLAPRLLGAGASLWAALDGHASELRLRSSAPLGPGVLLSYEADR